jgi:group II intron reverse transcriptase/maturase
MAQQAPDRALTSLHHHIDLEFMRVAHQRTRKDAAVGVDGQTAAQFGERLDENLAELVELMRSGAYKAPPVRRALIPKPGGGSRPIGIPTFADKVLQRAVAMVLEAVYEQDFRDCSYGFRPGRSAHQAVQTVWDGLMRMGGGWVVEVDIESFFDRLDHAHLRDFLDLRVRDGVLRRMIGKWLNAGVLTDAGLSRPKDGSPQGSVISPVLANVYLHHVLDEWFASVVRPRLHGDAFLVRYADDFVIVCKQQTDAQRVMDVLPKRFSRYGLTLSAAKTRLVRFTRPSGDDAAGAGTFTLLGFTHYWGRSRSGSWVVKRRTAAASLRRSLRKVTEWCRRNRHLPIDQQHKRLTQMLHGHFAYFGITGNHGALARFRYQVLGIWRKWLSRRSQKSRLSWARFHRILRRYPLPPARVVHSIYRHAANP